MDDLLADFLTETNESLVELDVALVPNLMAGVLGDRRRMQSDGIHPNARGAAIIAARLAPVVARALAARACVGHSRSACQKAGAARAGSLRSSSTRPCSTSAWALAWRLRPPAEWGWASSLTSCLLRE